MSAQPTLPHGHPRNQVASAEAEADRGTAAMSATIATHNGSWQARTSYSQAEYLRQKTLRVVTEEKLNTRGSSEEKERGVRGRQGRA